MDLDAIKFRAAINKGSELIDGFNIVSPPSNFKRAHYLGMSGVANCPRSLWFSFNEIEEYNGQKTIPSTPAPNVTRILRMGHRLEEEIVQFMELGGLEITGRQLEFHDFDNKFRGHCDGIVTLSDKYFFDVKSMNRDSFEKFCNSNIRDTFYTYYCQLNMYMHYGNLRTKSFIVGYCKDNSEVEVKPVVYEEPLVKMLRRKVLNILLSKTAETVVINRSEQHCDFCTYKNICNSLDDVK